MSLAKKIILTVILVIFLLFIQSFIFSETCAVSSHDNLSVVNYGCLENNCYFTIFNKAEIDSSFAFNNCYSNCNGNSDFSVRKECIDGCVNYLTKIPITLNNNLYFSHNCSDKTINLELNTNLKFEMKNNTTNLSINNLDSLNTNDYNIDIFVNNNDKLGIATFNFNFSKLIVSGDSLIEMSTVTRSNCVAWSDNAIYNRDSLKIVLKNLEVNESSRLDLKIEAKKNTTECNPGRVGGDVTLDVNSIINNGNINFDLKAADSGYGGQPNNCNQRSGYQSLNAGDAYFYVNFLDNFKDIIINVFSGNGGSGGKGSNAPANTSGWSSPYCRKDDPGNGGEGGNAGIVSFFIDQINNLENLEINLSSGNGGKGGDTGWDGGHFGLLYDNRNEAIGGLGGNGGNIFLCKTIWDDSDGYVCDSQKNYLSSYIYNLGILELNLDAGAGGQGGKKHNHEKYKSSSAGDGGDGGNIKNTEILFLNNKNEFNVNYSSGLSGLKGISSGGSNGHSGIINDFKIDYLINKSNKMNITLKNKKNPQNDDNSNFIINKLENGSSLPFKINLVNILNDFNFSGCLNDCNDIYCVNQDCSHCGDDESCLDQCEIPNCDEPDYSNCLEDCIFESNENQNETVINRAIKINDACYIKVPSYFIYNYKSSRLLLTSANNSEIISNILSNITVTSSINYNCSVCDYIDLENNDDIFPTSAQKFLKTYTLFSNIEFQISSGDLNIYYARNNQTMTSFQNYNPFLKINLPLYTNKNDIEPTYNEKLDLYEYKIEPSNLKWYYNPDLDLTNKNIYCDYQNYRIKGKINSQQFDFPFTPLFNFN